MKPRIFELRKYWAVSYIFCGKVRLTIFDSWRDAIKFGIEVFAWEKKQQKNSCANSIQ